MSSDATSSEGPTRDDRLPTRVRLVRGGYVLFAGLFVVGVLIQVYIAGMAVFVNPARWNLHASFVHVIEWIPLVMLVLSFPGRLPRELKLLPVGLFVLIIVQYATALGFSDSLVAAIHPVNALVIFGVAVVTTRRAWRETTDRHGKQRTASEPV
jgi:putative tricarboxylic transport membrane protein